MDTTLLYIKCRLGYYCNGCITFEFNDNISFYMKKDFDRKRPISLLYHYLGIFPDMFYFSIAIIAIYFILLLILWQIDKL